MAVTYKDIDLLTQKSAVVGTEKIPVSDTEFITPNQIAGIVPIDSSVDKESTNALQNGYITKTFLRGKSLTAKSKVLNTYMTRNGGNASNANSYHYNLYDVTAGSHYAFTIYLGSSYSTGYIRAVIWLDSNNNVISYSDEGNTIGASKNYFDKIVVAPAGAVMAAVNCYNGTEGENFKYVEPPSPDILLCTPQTLSDDEKAQARANIGAGTSSFSGSYNDLSDKPTIPNITVSSSEPTAQDGSDGDIWIVV